MFLPKLANPRAYQGLFIIDFGDSVSVGYTAAEVALLLEMERFQDSKVYKIHNAYPDGRMELVGVVTSRFRLESGMFFFSRKPEDAQADFENLALLAEQHPVPSRAKLQVAELPGATQPYGVALIYPSEFDNEWSCWLTDVRYKGGESCDTGISYVKDWYESAKISASIQLHGVLDRDARPLAELVASAGMPIQRKAS